MRSDSRSYRSESLRSSCMDSLGIRSRPASPDPAHTGEPSPRRTGSDAPSLNSPAVATSWETIRRFPSMGGAYPAPRAAAPGLAAIQTVEGIGDAEFEARRGHRALREAALGFRGIDRRPAFGERVGAAGQGLPVRSHRRAAHRGDCAQGGAGVRRSGGGAPGEAGSRRASGLMPSCAARRLRLHYMGEAGISSAGRSDSQESSQEAPRASQEFRANLSIRTVIASPGISPALAVGKYRRCTAISAGRASDEPAWSRASAP